MFGKRIGFQNSKLILLIKERERRYLIIFTDSFLNRFISKYGSLCNCLMLKLIIEFSFYGVCIATISAFYAVYLCYCSVSFLMD